MAKNVITLRIHDETIDELKKIFGEDVTVTDMIKATVDDYLNDIKKTEMNIVNLEIPFECLSAEELKNLYKDVCEIENKVAANVIMQGYDYNLEYVKAIQRTKNILIAHMSINQGTINNDHEIQGLRSKLNGNNRV